jgi:hypothetical protein
MKLTFVISFVVQLAVIASVPAFARNLGMGNGGSKSKGSKATSNGKGGWGWGWMSPTSSKMGCKSSKSSKMGCKKKKNKKKKKKKMTMHPASPAPHKVKKQPTVAPTPRPVTSVTPTPRPLGTPEQGYCADAVNYGTNGHKYLIPSWDAGLWKDANASAANLTCCGQPGHLATISNPGENNFVAALISAVPCWIGLSDPVWSDTGSTGTNAEFKWSNGEPYNWQVFNGFPGKAPTPNTNPLAEAYVKIYSDGAWANAPFSSTIGYIVEFDCI